MRRIDEMGRLNRFGKAVAPALASLAARPPLAQGMRLLETALAIMQGKGAGSGWDLQGEIRAAARTVQRDQPVIFDVGANYGAWSLGMQQTLAPQQPRFYLVEPASACQATLHALPLPHKTVFRAAAGEHAGEVVLLGGASGDEAASLYLRRDSYHQSTAAPIRETVPMVALDDLFDAYAPETVDFLKLDVEGHELAALLGARRALAAGRVRALAFEFGSGQINSRTWFHDFWDLLAPLGYTLHRILPGGGLLHVPAYYEDLEYFRGVSNYLAVYARGPGGQGENSQHFA